MIVYLCAVGVFVMALPAIAVIFHLNRRDNFSLISLVYKITTYVVGSKGFRPDIQKPRQMENAVRVI